MCSFRRSAAILLMLLLGAAGDAFPFDGAWSRHAVQIPSRRDFTVPSPDRKRSLFIRERMLSAIEGGQPVAGCEAMGILFPLEAGWAPDSGGFFLTMSDGGPDGPWDAGVYVLESGRCTRADVTGAAVETFRARHPCADRDQPDIGAVKWLKDAKQLLLVAEVPRQAACAGRGTLRGYAVEVPDGRIIREYDQAKLMEEWGEYLGSRFGRILPSRN